MVTAAHEALHSIFRHDEDSIARVIHQVFGVAVGQSGRVTVLNTDLTESRPLERRADSVILLGREEGREEGRAAGLEEGIASGRVQMRIEDILRILDRRGVSVPDHDRKIITSCTDRATLESWFDRALTAEDIKDMFHD